MADPVTMNKISTLVDLLRLRAEQEPDRCAYIFLKDGEREHSLFTHNELDHRARAIAATLQSMGAAGERVLLPLSSGLDFIAAFFGCQYAGAMAIPAQPPRTGKQPGPPGSHHAGCATENGADDRRGFELH